VDPISRRSFWDLIRRLAGEGVTVFVTTHYMDEAEYCDRLALIYRGRLIALGTPDQLKTEHMPDAVLEVAVDRAVDALEIAARADGVREAALFGPLLHVVVADAGTAAPAVRIALESAGIAVEHVERILPSLEDVFVSLIESEDRASRTDAAPPRATP
jgi:ABC-2 type transport system ATP-binding protein